MEYLAHHAWIIIQLINLLKIHHYKQNTENISHSKLYHLNNLPKGWLFARAKQNTKRQFNLLQGSSAWSWYMDNKFVQ